MGKKRKPPQEEPDDFNEEDMEQDGIEEGEQLVGEIPDTVQKQFVWTAWDPVQHEYTEVDTEKPFLSLCNVDINQYTRLPKICCIFNIFRFPMGKHIYECRCETASGIVSDKLGYGINMKYYFKDVTHLSEEEQFELTGKEYTYYYDGKTSLDKCIKKVQDLVKAVNKVFAKCEEFNDYVLGYRTKLVDMVETLLQQYAAQLVLLSDAEAMITKFDKAELLEAVLVDRNKLGKRKGTSKKRKGTRKETSKGKKKGKKGNKQ